MTTNGWASLMPVLEVRSLTVPGGSRFGFDSRIDAFLRDARAAAEKAAQAATQESRSRIPHSRPVPPRRNGRNHGRLSDVLMWKADQYSVYINEAEMNRRNPYWIVQEIGTGNSATAKVGGSPNPRGNAKKGATYIRTVKSQKGRQISSALAFGTGPNGKFVPFGDGAGQQLYYRNKLKGGAPWAAWPVAIRNEIQPSGFVQAGAKTGFRVYRASVLAAARQAFGGHPRP